ncbi:MAG TPA: lytic transglycosylase domain-containing protein [Pyrinomonadaceae bacterium]|nr:lytic transglycosylase domain-containing protein [Pyrinomonadaceae bacterium]
MTEKTKTLAIIAVICCFLSITAANAQNRSRVFDNFDFRGGVQVISPTVAPVTTTKRTKTGGKKTVEVASNKQTKAVTGNVQDGLASRELVKATSYNKLVMGTSSNMKGFTTGSIEIDSYIVDSSRRYNIDPLLIYSQMHQESSFKLKATSYKGASGLMQLMPATARRFGVTDIYDPQQNIDAGVKYMRWLLNTFGGDVNLALAGYNAGEGAVMKYGNQIPPYRETQEYVRRITARYNSISNPMIAKAVRKVSAVQAVKLEEKEAKPLTIYEPDAIAIRTPDGRMRLVNQ